MINKDLIEKIGLQPEVERRVLLKGVSQNVLKDIEITINGQPYLTNMYAADIRNPLLLGLDFLHRFCCNIDLGDITLRIGDNVVAETLKTNTYNDDIPVSKVLVARTTFVPANTILRTVVVEKQLDNSKDFVLELDTSSVGIDSSSILVKGSKLIPIEFINMTDHSLRIGAGNSIGIISEAV